MMGQSARCYTPSFVEIGPPVPEKTIFMVFTIYGHGGHLDHVTWTILYKLLFLFPKVASLDVWL